MKYIKHGQSKKDKLNKIIVLDKNNEKNTFLISNKVKKELDNIDIQENDEFFNDFSKKNKGVDKTTNPFTITDIVISKSKSSVIVKKETVIEKEESELNITEEMKSILTTLKSLTLRVEKLIKK